MPRTDLRDHLSSWLSKATSSNKKRMDFRITSPQLIQLYIQDKCKHNSTQSSSYISINESKVFKPVHPLSFLVLF
uniref:Putative ovule protein n=1 Tax=Solanum chacoense TaxID=4108 RepID=A0A0V0HV56_SOLCH